MPISPNVTNLPPQKPAQHRKSNHATSPAPRTARGTLARTDSQPNASGADPDTLARSWKAQRRLHARYLHLILGNKKTPSEAAVAVARELAGFVWAEMTA